MKYTEKQIRVRKIKVDQNINPRIALDNEYAEELAELINEKHKLDPVIVYKDPKSKVLYLVDGFHRLEAHKNAGKDKIPCKVAKGSYKDAYIAACAANATHGKQLTTKEKRRIVSRILQDKSTNSWTDSRIAKHCGVSQPFVSNVRHDLEEEEHIDIPEEREKADGKKIKIGNIGKKTKKRNHGPVDDTDEDEIDFEEDEESANESLKPIKKDYKIAVSYISDLEELLKYVKTALQKVKMSPKELEKYNKAREEIMSLFFNVENILGYIDSNSI
jgi:ParB/RepB/Spo0J family partition protein